MISGPAIFSPWVGADRCRSCCARGCDRSRHEKDDRNEESFAENRLAIGLFDDPADQIPDGRKKRDRVDQAKQNKKNFQYCSLIRLIF